MGVVRGVNMLSKLLNLLGVRHDVESAAHLGVNPVYFTYVYENPDGMWTFSWHDSAHKIGASIFFWCEHEAEVARKFWEDKKTTFEKASFVRP